VPSTKDADENGFCIVKHRNHRHYRLCCVDYWPDIDRTDSFRGKEMEHIESQTTEKNSQMTACLLLSGLVASFLVMGWLICRSHGLDD